jgi:carbamoylphosphate synthase small subunit
MDPLTAGAIAAPIAGGIIGAISKSNSDAQARQLIQQAVDQYNAIGIPAVDAMKVITEQLRSTGQMTPQLEQTFQQADSEMNGVTTDPRGKEAQYAALQQLEDLGNNGGMTLTDQANLEHTLGGIDTKARGAREAINSSLKARGAYGSGAELAAKLQGQQADNQMEHEAGLNTAASARDRACRASSMRVSSVEILILKISTRKQKLPQPKTKSIDSMRQTDRTLPVPT